MKAPSASEVLSAWESGAGRGRLRRSFGLLALLAEGPHDDPAELSIGARDARLVALRRQLFGPQLSGVASCPTCSDWLEWSCDIDQLALDVAAAPRRLWLELGAHRVCFRLPSSSDLEAVAGLADEVSARRALLERCLLEASLAGAPLPAPELSDELCDAVVQRMAETDPCADLEFGLACACGHGWQARFDIEGFLWTELEVWAGRLLSEVHVIASAYGWTEGEILRLSPARRRTYIGLVSA